MNIHINGLRKPPGIVKSLQKKRVPRNFRHSVAAINGDQRVLIERLFADNRRKLQTLSSEEFASYQRDLTEYGIRPNLAVQKINDVVGDGLFLKEGAEPIPANTFIGLYAGKFQISHKDEEIDSPYLFTVLADLKLSRGDIQSIGGSLKDRNCYYLEVDGIQTGNFTRYLNHSKKKANLAVRYVRMPDRTIQIGFWTQKEIQPGEQLLLNYGSAYWKAKGIEPIADE